MRDEHFYERSYAKWQDDDDLPSRGMLMNGLPEGVLDNGGAISGYLYFDVGARRERRLNFRAEFTDSDRESLVALIKIPFRGE